MAYRQFPREETTFELVQTTDGSVAYLLLLRGVPAQCALPSRMMSDVIHLLPLLPLLDYDGFLDLLSPLVDAAPTYVWSMEVLYRTKRYHIDLSSTTDAPKYHRRQAWDPA